jgi:hypothetical protein
MDHSAGLDSGADRILWRLGRVITTATPNKNYELQKLEKKYDKYLLRFLLFCSVM